MDRNILLTFYEYASRNKPFGMVVLFVAKYSSFLFMLIYVAMGYGLFLREPKKMSIYIGVPLVTLGVCLSMRKLINRKRPSLLATTFSIPKKTSASFPSNHAASASIIAFSCMYVDKTIGMFVFFLAILTGLSRVFVGLHYPSDVLFGFILSGVFAFLGFGLLAASVF